MQKLWIQSVKENGKKLCLENQTYNEIDQIASSIGSWLSQRNYQIVYIHSRNRVEWSIIDIACWKYGLVSVPLYDTLGK